MLPGSFVLVRDQLRSRKLGTLDARLVSDTLTTVSRHGTSGARAEDKEYALTVQYKSQPYFCGGVAGRCITMSTATSELRSRDAAVSKKLDGTIEEQKKLLDQHIDIQVQSASTQMLLCCSAVGSTTYGSD